MRTLPPLELHEFDSQPFRIGGTATLDAAPSAVFAELGDPSLWFPLMLRSVWKTGATSGVGAEREINHALFGRARERFIVWEHDARIAFTMTRMSSRLVDQMGEDWRISREGGATRLEWKVVATPSRAGRLVQPVLRHTLNTMFARACTNIGKRAATFKGKTAS
jgi:Polyketide cyclase / dehydrase and lipid transport